MSLNFYTYYLNFHTYYLNYSISVSTSLVFQIVGRSHRWSLYSRMLVEDLQLNNRIIDHLEKCGLFSDLQYGFRSFQSTADPLTVVLDRNARVFNRSGNTQYFIHPRLLTGWSMLIFFTNLGLMKFQVGYLALFILFLVIDGFGWFWMSLYKNIQLLLEFLKAPFLVLHFSYYTLMTFLMLSVILLSALIILLSTLNVIRHLICDSN